jgi:general secretion pathway protein K
MRVLHSPRHWRFTVHAYPRTQQRGAALLLAMVAVTLIVSLAGAMVWQQQRAIQVEAAERARGQSGWILLGALDWSRLILREDARTGAVDHAGEPWATPLAEARLSTFLAAEKGVASDDDGPEAFLSGSIVDAQARYNLRNLMAPAGGTLDKERLTLGRLCEAAGLPADTATRLAASLRAAWVPDTTRGTGTGGASSGGETLSIRRFDQLAWLNVEPGTINALRASVDILPLATPINVNTAPPAVLAAVFGVDLGVAQRLVEHRQRSPFANLEAMKPLLPQGVTPDPQRVAVSTQFFEINGRLRLDERVLEERSLVQRKGSGNTTEVITLHRERRSLDLAAR